jgi:hypothetical protein
MRLLKRDLIGYIAALGVLIVSPDSRANAEPLHTYRSSLGQEVANVIAVSMSKLFPLVPAGYTIIPASSVGLGFGTPDQGLIVIANVRNFDPTVDGRRTSERHQVPVGVAVLIAEPPEAAQAGLSIPGAFHLYALAIYTNDARYAASMRGADMPVKFVDKIQYRRDMDDASGIGSLIVSVPVHQSAFITVNSGLGYAPVPGPFNTVLWHDSDQGKAALHLHNESFRQGSALSQIYTQPHSFMEALLDGGGLGPCGTDPNTGYSCIVAPSLNLRYDQGLVWTL